MTNFKKYYAKGDKRRKTFSSSSNNNAGCRVIIGIMLFIVSSLAVSTL